MSAGVAARVAAARVLDVVLHQGRSLKASLAAALPALEDPRDRALVEATVFTALRQRARYDAALALWLAKPLGSRDQELRALLHAGFAQWEMGLPPHAVIAATVDAARALGRAHQAGLVNAVLRRAQREGLPQADAAGAWPQWLARRLRDDWPAQADSVFAESARAAPMWLRVNRRMTTPAGYAEILGAAGIDSTRGDAVADGLCLETGIPVQQLPGFDSGMVSVQDAAAQRVADALAPPAGARLLDACAAPGGKSAHLLERDPSLRVLALDIDPRRVRRMQETFARLGLDVDARAADATQPGKWWDGVPFDAVLIDAPCSATGIVRRQPDVLLHRREDDIAALTAIQSTLLDAVWPLLAPGGRVLYATCSILHQENSAQVQAFLERTPDAALDALDESYGHDTGFGHQRLPGEQGMDGFFYARLRKRAQES